MTSTLFPSKPRRLTVSSVISDISTMLRAHFRLFFGLALISYLPLKILSPLLPGGSPFLANLLFATLNHFFFFLSQAAASFAILRILQGRSADISSSLSEATSCLAPLLSFALIMAAIFVSISCVQTYTDGLLSAADSAKHSLGEISASAAIMLLLVGGMLFLTCTLNILIPVCAVERRGMIGSIKRSFALTRGYRLMFLGLMLVYLLTFACLRTLIYSLLLKSFFLPLPFLKHLIREVFAFSQEVILCPMLPIAYYRLIEIKEGASTVVR